MKILVIGGGIAGLATSALLGKDGHKVTLVEKNNDIGGRARLYTDKDYIFDIGPSWYLMPKIFEKYFDLFDKKTSDYYELQKLKNHYKIFFPSNNSYTITDNFDDNVSMFESVEKGSGESLREYIKIARELNDIATEDLIYKDYDDHSSFLDLNVVKNLPKMRLFSSFHKHVEKYIKNEELQKVLEFSTVFLGGSPYNTPAFYSILSYTDLIEGVWYPKGGMYKFIEGLINLAEENGVEIITGVDVNKINVVDGNARSIETNKGQYEADLIVNTADYQFSETKLLDIKWQTYKEPYWEKKTLAPSCFNIYVGVNKKLKNVEHHNFYFNNTWEEHFENVYKNPKWPEAPSYYVHVPTVTDKSVAPNNSTTMFFLVPVAPGLDDTEKVREEFSDKVIKHFATVIGDDYIPNIEVKEVYSQKNYIKDYNAYKGTAFGLAHTLKQTSFMRPKNKSKKVKNLFYAGQYTNPGVGMPMALVSAQITSKLVQKY